MSMSQFGNVRVVLAEPNAELRAGLHNCLQSFGFSHIVATGNLARVADAVQSGEVDLIIADNCLPEGDFNEFVRGIRFGHQGSNPFLVVITMVYEPSRSAVHAAINSGTDLVLAKPFAPQNLLTRIKDLIHERKRFVATAEYIGPDRRNSSRPDAMDVPLLDVPNPLHHRMSEHISKNHERRLINSARDRINEQMVQRQACHIGWLLQEAMPLFRSAQDTGQIEATDNMIKLAATSADICKRLRGTTFSHASSVCMTLDQMLSNLLGEGLEDVDLNLLERMGAIIEKAFDPNRRDAASDYQRRAKTLEVFKPGLDEAVKEDEEVDPDPMIGDTDLDEIVMPQGA